MNVIQLVETLLGTGNPPSAKSVLEASVHLPRRGKKWIATFRDGSGKQLWKSTGLTDRRAALRLANEYEKEARRRYAAQLGLPKGPTIGLRQGSDESDPWLFTQREIALIMGISERAVRDIQRRAIEKLRRNPRLRELWREWKGGQLEGAFASDDLELTPAEIAAVYGLAQTPAERQVLQKLIALIA